MLVLWRGSKVLHKMQFCILFVAEYVGTMNVTENHILLIKKNFFAKWKRAIHFIIFYSTVKKP